MLNRIMENERELRQKFEDMVEQYAQQHSSLEAQMRQEYHLKDPSSTDKGAMSSSTSEIRKSSGDAGEASAPPDRAVSSGSSKGEESSAPPPTAQEASAVLSGSDEDEDDFHDAMDDEDEIFTISAPPCYGSTDMR